MLHAEHRRLEYPGQPVDLGFDLPGIDVVAAADHQILAAADDADIAARIDLAQIAGNEITVGPKLGARLLGLTPVACKDVRSLHFDHADLAGGQRPAAA